MGRKLTIFLIDGTEVGPRTVEIGNWSGKAIYSKRSAITKIINRKEFNKPGVYILKGTPENDMNSESIYIGEAEKLGSRLKQHLTDTDKDFTEFIAFMSKDELLTKSHIKYLESRLIRLAKEADNSEIQNGNQPELPLLPETDISDMEFFTEQIKIILPVMNFMFLIPSTDTNYDFELNEKIEDEIEYTLKSKKFHAKMYESEKGFIVLKGSECNKKTTKSISDGWLKHRGKLIASGILKDIDDKFVFTDNAVFSSISAASSILLGRQSAGPIEWVNSAGKTYKEIMEDTYNTVIEET